MTSKKNSVVLLESQKKFIQFMEKDLESSFYQGGFKFILFREVILSGLPSHYTSGAGYSKVGKLN